ncbi:MAG: hypothetical protein ACR2LM_00500 [Pyrinomonadaceae bacterium]
MQIRLAVALTVVIVASGFACKHHDQTRSPASQPPIDYESEQHAIVSAVIREMYATGPTRNVVIQNPDPCPTPEATPDPDVEELRQRMETNAFKRLPDVVPDTMTDFQTRKKECHPLARKLDVSVEYALLGQKDLELLFPKNGDYKKFYAKYPQSSGTINFSNPGFNRDYTQAVVSTGRFCGLRCGEGYFVLLTKDGGVWKIKTKVDTWIS